MIHIVDAEIWDKGFVVVVCNAPCLQGYGNVALLVDTQYSLYETRILKSKAGNKLTTIIQVSLE